MKILSSMLILTAVLFAGCQSTPIEGKWQYDGGIYNGKTREAAPEFTMQRTYAADTYEGHVIEGEHQERYTAGTYEVKKDSLFLTSTFSNQPSQLTGRTQAYQFQVNEGKLTIKGVLPNGMQVEEYWKKVD